MHYVPTMIHRRGLLRQVTCSDTPCFPVPLIALGVLCFTAPLFCHVTIIHIPPNQKLTFHLVKVGVRCVCVCVRCWWCVCCCVCVCVGGLCVLVCVFGCVCVCVVCVVCV